MAENYQQASGMDCCGCPPPCCPPPSCCIPPPCRYDDSAAVAAPARKRLRFDANVIETYEAKQRQARRGAPLNTYSRLDDDCCCGPPKGICGPPPCCCQPCPPPQCCGGPCQSCSRYDDDVADSQSKSQVLRPEDLQVGAYIGIGGETYVSTGKLSSAMTAKAEADAQDADDNANRQQGSATRMDDDCGCPSCCPPCCPMGPPQTAGCSLPAPCCCDASRAQQQKQRQQTQQQQSSYFNDAYATSGRQQQRQQQQQRSVFSYRQPGPMRTRVAHRSRPY